MKAYTRTPREPLPLFTMRDGKPEQEKCYACGECGLVYSSRESAIYCCEQQVCESCGQDTYKAWVLCSDCRTLKMWASAELIEYQGGPVYWEQADKYFEDYDTAIDHFEDMVADGESEDIPEFLQPCEERPCPPLNMYQILESHVEELFEDAIDHLKGKKELQIAIDEFNQKQTLVTWFSDNKKKIKVVMP